MRNKRLLISLVGIALFIFILTRVDVSTILSSIAKVNPRYLALAVVLTVPMVILKAWRWRALLRMQGVDYDFRQAIPAYFGGIYLGLVTPGKVGDLAKVFYVVEDKEVSHGMAFSSVLLDRLFDLYVLLLVGAYGFITLSLLQESMALSIAIVAILLILPVLFLSRGFGKGLIGLMYRTRLFGRFEETIDASADQFYSGIDMVTNPRLAFPALITLAAYTIYFAQFYLLALSLDLSIPFFDLAVYAAVTSLVEMIPVSIAGIGTRDATLIALFSLQGISAESALSYSLLLLLTFYICPAVIGAIAWQIKPIRLSRKKER